MRCSLSIFFVVTESRWFFRDPLIVILFSTLFSIIEASSATGCNDERIPTIGGLQRKFCVAVRSWDSGFVVIEPWSVLTWSFTLPSTARTLPITMDTILFCKREPTVRRKALPTSARVLDVELRLSHNKTRISQEVCQELKGAYSNRIPAMYHTPMVSICSRCRARLSIEEQGWLRLINRLFRIFHFILPDAYAAFNQRLNFCILVQCMPWKEKFIESTKLQCRRVLPLYIVT